MKLVCERNRSAAGDLWHDGLEDATDCLCDSVGLILAGALLSEACPFIEKRSSGIGKVLVHHPFHCLDDAE